MLMIRSCTTGLYGSFEKFASNLVRENLEKNTCLWLSLLCIVRKQIIFSDRTTQHSTISLFQLLVVPPFGFMHAF